MYSYEDRMKAVELYIQYNLQAEKTACALGYGTARNIQRWYKEYKETGVLHKKITREKKYSEQQKEAALNYYLEHGQNITKTAKTLGYPHRDTLSEWIDEAIQRVILEIHQELQIIKNMAVEILGFVNHKNQRFVLFFVVVINLVLDLLKHGGLSVSRFQTKHPAELRIELRHRNGSKADIFSLVKILVQVAFKASDCVSFAHTRRGCENANASYIHEITEPVLHHLKIIGLESIGDLLRLFAEWIATQAVERIHYGLPPFPILDGREIIVPFHPAICNLVRSDQRKMFILKENIAVFHTSGEIADIHLHANKLGRHIVGDSVNGDTGIVADLALNAVMKILVQPCLRYRHPDIALRFKIAVHWGFPGTGMHRRIMLANIVG